MARLFISPREIALVNDWTKEFVKDVVGQKIYYYAISVQKTQVHPVYNEAAAKVFENPVALSALVAQPEWTTRANHFGVEQSAKVEVFVQTRDLIDKNLTLSDGDFFTYGDTVFEVASAIQMNDVFGQEEYQLGFKLTGILARPGQFDPKAFYRPQKDSSGPYEGTPVQQVFSQQRGLKTTSEGPTGDFRQLRDRLGNDMAPAALGEGPRTVDMSDAAGDARKASSFDNDPPPVPRGFYDE